MPSKWQRSKGKRVVQTKKKTVAHRPAAAMQQSQSMSVPAPAQAERVAKPAPAPRATAASAGSAAAAKMIGSNPYVTTELRNIAILAAIMIVILIVLSFILR